ncbi:MAG: ParB/RepB/Spo0J family partition protein [Acidobacteria bacterium]|nr:ParB/RepB/Spo0J family partition protein [Acidobacteriota bacterium]
MAKLDQMFAKKRPSQKQLAPIFEDEGTRYSEIDIALIKPDPNQPRKDLGDLSGLIESIREHNLIQPIIVAKEGREYIILAGERRFAAAKEAGLTKMPSLIRKIDWHRKLELQLIENLQRKGLNPLEEANAYARLIEEHSLQQEDLAKRVGVSAPTINQSLRLLKLPESIQTEVATLQTSEVSKSVLLEIAKSPKEKQPQMWKDAKKGKLTVKAARAVKSGEAEVREAVTEKPATYREIMRVPGCDVIFVFQKSKANKRDLRRVIDALLEELG